MKVKDMDSLRNVLLQEVRDKFPAIDWKLGSVFRELVVEPLLSISDKLEELVTKSYEGIDVKTICQNPIYYEKYIDSWLERLALVPAQNNESTGTVRILCSSSDDIIIPKNTQFTWNGELSVYTAEQIKITADTRLQAGGGLVRFIKYSDEAYAADIPVKCSGSYSGTLSEGSPVNWSGAPKQVYDIYVSSTIDGGKSIVSAVEKASLLLSAFAPDTTASGGGIKKAMTRAFSNSICDVLPADHSSPVLRNADVGSCVLYIKPNKQPKNFDITGIVGKGGCVLLENCCGLYSVNRVMTSKGEIVSHNTKYSANFGDSKSTAEIYVSTSAGERVTVNVTGFEEYYAIDKWLNSGCLGTPFSFVLAAPAVCRINVFAGVSGPSTVSARSELSAHISALPINSALSVSDISDILGKHNLFLVGSPTMSINVLHRGRSWTYTTKSTTQEINRVMSGTPIAMYATDTSIELKNAK